MTRWPSGADAYFCPVCRDYRVANGDPLEPRIGWGIARELIGGAVFVVIGGGVLLALLIGAIRFLMWGVLG